MSSMTDTLTIDEYVGGDAYNYIIGASLVGGRISGFIAGKTVATVAGAMCVCAGAVMLVIAGGTRSTGAPARRESGGPRHSAAPRYERPGLEEMDEDDE